MIYNQLQREPTQAGCPLTSTVMLWHTCTVSHESPHSPTPHTYTLNKISIKLLRGLDKRVHIAFSQFAALLFPIVPIGRL